MHQPITAPAIQELDSSSEEEDDDDEDEHDGASHGARSRMQRRKTPAQLASL